MLKRTLITISSVVAISLVLVGGGLIVKNRHDIERSIERASLPSAVPYHEMTTAPPPAGGPVAEGTVAAKKTVATPAPTPLPKKSTPPATGLPAEINLAIPFTSQAPHGSWELPYKEYCEEASALMAGRYLASKPITGADDAAAAMNAIKAFEEKEFGYWEDTTAEEVATILKKHFAIKQVQVKVNPTVEDIKQAVAAGKPVVVPAAGRRLGNPFYTPPGPLYHMLVVKGYTADNKFITNDPGTRRGADFLYNTDVFMNAIHDWRADGNVESGRKVILIVG